ncbi:MAG: hypothetical protein KDA25_10890, partial [Phycisphaerales bacterium]|nr:hypothetical protein [Phycisphaerales bacterium]
MALPRIITRSLDACQGLNFAGGLFGFGTAVSATTGITLGPVALGLAVTTLAGLAAYATYQQWRTSDQHDRCEAVLDELVRKQGSLLAGLEHIIEHEPDLQQKLPPEMQGRPLRVFYELLKAKNAEREAILNEHSNAITFLAARIDAEFATVATMLDATRADLAHLRNRARRADRSFDEILAHVRPQPILELPLLAESGTRTDLDRLNFRARTTDLFGRDDAMAALEAFLDAPKPDFSWWMVTGPGGMGKSRLALDLCVDRVNDWDVGFFVSAEDRVWSSWTPRCPTLIVFDYLLTKTDELARAIGLMTGRSFPHPVRFLILEREAHGAWWEGIRSADQGQHRTNQILSRHGEALELAGLDEDDRCRLFAELLPDEPDHRHLARLAHQLDPQGRPLYAAMAAQAVRDHGVEKIRTWDTLALTEHVLDRERARWRKLIPNDAARRRMESLLCLSTLARGLSRDPDPLRDERIRDLLPSPGDFDGDRFREMTGSAHPDALPALEPDLLGEWFVLQTLARHAPADRRALVFAAWHRKGLDTAFACFQVISDFRQRNDLDMDATVFDLLEIPAGIPAANATYDAGDIPRTVAYLSLVIDADDAPAEQVARARVNRGFTYEERGVDGDRKPQIAQY